MHKVRNVAARKQDLELNLASRKRGLEIAEGNLAKATATHRALAWMMEVMLEKLDAASISQTVSKVLNANKWQGAPYDAWANNPLAAVALTSMVQAEARLAGRVLNEDVTYISHMRSGFRTVGVLREWFIDEWSGYYTMMQDILFAVAGVERDYDCHDEQIKPFFDVMNAVEQAVFGPLEAAVEAAALRGVDEEKLYAEGIPAGDVAEPEGEFLKTVVDAMLDEPLAV